MQVRVFNDFKRRLLNGEVSADFPCTAVPTINEELNHPRYWSEPSKYRSAG